MTHDRHAKDRAEFQKALSRQVRELSRSRAYSDLPAKSGELVAALSDSTEEERDRLREVVARIGSAGRFAPTTPEVLARADRAEAEGDLTPPDAIVYASVVLETAAEPGVPKCFLNRNSRDFMNPRIQAELRRGGCRLLFSFRDGLALITHSMQ